MTTIIPDDGKEKYPEWTRVSNWIDFFDLLNKGENVWIRVETQFISTREGLVTVDIDASDLGFYIFDAETQQGGYLGSFWLNYFLISEKYWDLNQSFLRIQLKSMG